MNAAEATVAIVTASEWLEDLGMRPFLWGGTLLGAIRENRILPWDGDVDLGVLAEEAPPRLADRLPGVYRSTPILPYMLGVAPMAQGNVGLSLLGVKVGIHVMTRGARRSRYYTFRRRLVRVPEVAPLMPRHLLGIDVRVPNDPTGALRWLYGATWRRPIVDYNGHDPEKAAQRRYLVPVPA